MRDPRKLGEHRVDVQITLGDLRDPVSLRHAMRGVDTVVHLAATIRDQPRGTIEELNGLATIRLLRSAETGRRKALRLLLRDGRDRIPADPLLPLEVARRARRRELAVATTVFAPSIVYRPGDPWITLLQRLSILPAVPVSGEG